MAGSQRGKWKEKRVSKFGPIKRQFSKKQNYISQNIITGSLSSFFIREFRSFVQNTVIWQAIRTNSKETCFLVPLEF